MASGGIEQKADSMCCSVCWEKYDRSDHLPLMLRCQHTFCRYCIANLQKHSLDGFECPVCRSKISSKGDIMTNMAVRDIVEELQTKVSSKIHCCDHPSKVCCLFCLDCCQPLCTACVTGIKNSIHKEHDLEDIENASILKARLTTLLDQKITDLEKTSASVNERLKQKEQKHAEDVDYVVTMITSIVSAWKEEQLQTVKKKVEQTRNKQEQLTESLKSAWEERQNMSDLKGLATAYQASKKENSTIPKESIAHIGVQQESIDQLQGKLCSLCEAIVASIAYGEIQHTSHQRYGVWETYEQKQLREAPISARIAAKMAVLRAGLAGLSKATEAL